MQTRVKKWGNSLALRIPKSIAEEMRLHERCPVELKVVKGKLVVHPTQASPSLDELLRGVTDENTHGEWDAGPPVGKESL